MSKSDKFIMRFLSRPKDFTYSELKVFLSSFGYKEIQGVGSRVCFARENHKIKLHKPHPDNILKRYQIDFVTKELTDQGLI
jgi:hypothetical protein